MTALSQIIGWLDKRAQKKEEIERRDPGKRGRRAERLRLWAIILGGPMLTGILVWQLWTLDPVQWCKTSYDIARLESDGIVEALRSCISLQGQILTIKDHAIIGLLVGTIVTYLVLIVSQYKVTASVTGPGGFGVNLDSDDDGTTNINIADHGSTIDTGNSDSNVDINVNGR